MAPLLIQLAADNTLRKAPPPFLASTGAKACVMRTIPKTLVSNCARAASLASGLSRPPGRAIPALLTTRVTSLQIRAAAATSLSEVQSGFTGTTVGVLIEDGLRAPA